MGVIAWIVLGAVVSGVAEAISPLNERASIPLSMIVVLVGAQLGGFLGNLVTGSALTGFSLWGVQLAVVGSLIFLWIYRATTRPSQSDPWRR